MQDVFSPNQFQLFVISELESDECVAVEFCTVGFNSPTNQRVVAGAHFIVNKDRDMAYCIPTESSLKKLKAKSYTLQEQTTGFGKAMSSFLDRMCPSESGAEHYHRASLKEDDNSLSMVFAVRHKNEYEKLGVILDNAGYARLKDLPTPKAA